MSPQPKTTINNYLSLIKFSHTIFALPFAVIGYFLAIHVTHSPFSLKLFGLIVLCMVFARSAAMAFNRFIDRKIDEQNERTAVREIPAGTVKAKAAFIFVIVNCILFVATTFYINSICFYLSPVALTVVLGYSLTKRFTSLCHVVLGIGLSLAPIGAYLAVTGQFDWLPLFFSFAVLFWVSGFDIIYALQDEEFDKSKNLKSIPVWLGKKGALILSTVFHLISSGFIIYAGIFAAFNFWYWIGVFVFTGLLFYQHTLVKPTDLSKVNLAFFTTNGIASVVFAVFVLIGLYF
ncbi:MAG: 4-hydroxybenzoate octaprenyltransferase [Bacteroidetes bacterium RIFCSPLOWO2_12_FULL_35_15]|nr:MAG: 4-hydroxybenzoate octaprenyltransferase [Bacteroidetes bacterium RIFCSPLOWO2_12_FULL_35_15]